MTDYNLQYYHEYYDIEGTYHRIDILALEYSGGSTLIEVSGETPVVMRHAGADKNSFESIIIQGQELQFNFFVLNTDVTAFDTLFESEYKDYQIKYYVGGYSDSYIEFIGWIDPENLTKEYSTNPPYVEINLSANDGLVALKEIEFRHYIDDSLLNVKLPILIVLKHALGHTGLLLDFMVQLGTYETTDMASTECALDRIFADSKRFIGGIFKEEDSVVKIQAANQGGRKYWSYDSFVFGGVSSISDPMNCWSVIESVLVMFNVTLKQHKGRYYITNKHELDSYVFHYDFATLTQQSRTATSNVIDVSNYKYKIGVEQQKVKPLKNVKITYKNKDLGGSLMGAVNLNNWTQDVVWHVNGGTSTSTSLYPTTTTDLDVTLVATFAVTKVTENDYLKVTFDCFCAPPSSVNLFSCLILLNIIYPDGSLSAPTQMGFAKRNFQFYESWVWDGSKINSSGDYKIKISFLNFGWDNPFVLTGTVIGVNNMTISKVIDAAETEQSNLVTYDRHYEQTLNKNTATFETETILGDSYQLSEIGAFFYFNAVDGLYHPTEAWNTYGNTEGLKIIDLYARNVLNNRDHYKNYLRCTVIDRLHTIGLNNILTIDSKNYAITSYNRNFKLGELHLEIIELLTTPKTYGNIIEVTGESINGESTTQSRNVNVSAGAIHNSLAGLEGGAGVHYYHISAELFSKLGDTEAFFINDTLHRVGIGTTSPAGKLDVRSPANNDIIAMFGTVASVDATYPGYIYISDVNTINAGYNVNGNAPMWINYVGYQNGNTQFRDLNIADGKTNVILFVDGSAGAVGVGTTDPGVKLTTQSNYNAFPATTGTSQPSGALRIVGGDNAVIDFGTNSTDTWMQATNKAFLSETYNILINPNGGDVGIGATTTPTYKLQVTGTGYFSDILYAGTHVGTTTFISGFAGSGWQMSYTGGDATLTVDNLVIRKALTAYELDINKINSINGGIIVSVANGTALNVVDTSDTQFEIYFDEEGTSKQIQFVVGDYVRGQVWTGRGIGSYVGLVNTVNHSATYGSAYIIAVTVSGEPWDGIELVQIGNSSDAARQNLIYITASDSNNPYIDMLAGVDDGSFSGKQKLRIGNLTGITDSNFGGALTGYGLWADNVYLTGGIVASTGSIGGWTINSAYLAKDTGTNSTSAGLSPTDYPFFGGATYANRATAPFRVTNAGAIHAESGDIGGWTINNIYLAKDTGVAATSSGMAPNDYPFFAGATYANRATAPFRVNSAGIAHGGTITGAFYGAYSTSITDLDNKVSISPANPGVIPALIDLIDVDGDLISETFILPNEYRLFTQDIASSDYNPAIYSIIIESGGNNITSYMLSDNSVFSIEGRDSLYVTMQSGGATDLLIEGEEVHIECSTTGSSASLRILLLNLPTTIDVTGDNSFPIGTVCKSVGGGVAELYVKNQM